MKCFCCKDGNLTNFACNECQNIICFKCINELKNNIDTTKIKICNTCVTKSKYKNYINLVTPELKRDLEQGILTKLYRTQVDRISTIFSMIIMIAPVIGPVVGGYICFN